MEKVSVLYSKIGVIKKSISIDDLIKKLPLDLQKQNLAYLHEQDRFAHAISRLLLVKLLDKFTQKNSNFLSNLKFNSHQKPYFDLNFHFNISHSGDYVLCAASKAGNLGIDIEKKRALEIHGFEDLFTSLEWQDITTAQNPAIFFDYWSKKESIIKADGRGLGVDLKSILIQNNRATLENQAYYLFPLFIDFSIV